MSVGTQFIDKQVRAIFEAKHVICPFTVGTSIDPDLTPPPSPQPAVYC